MFLQHPLTAPPFPITLLHAPQLHVDWWHQIRIGPTGLPRRPISLPCAIHCTARILGGGLPTHHTQGGRQGLTCGTETPTFGGLRGGEDKGRGCLIYSEEARDEQGGTGALLMSSYASWVRRCSFVT